MADPMEDTGNLRIGGKELVQSAQFLRASKGKSFARGNTSTDVSFQITREHATAQACEEFILEHHSSIPKTGNILFIAEGVTQRRYKLSDACFEDVSHDQTGVSSIHTYRFSGGDFEAI
jgi:hypothetical protein